jgi:hypothetical protein
MPYNTLEKLKAYKIKNKEKTNLIAKRYREKNKIKIKERLKLYALNNPEKIKLAKLKQSLKKRYKLTLDEYNEMYRKQESKCGICGIHENNITKKLNIDHDHRTGKARELLCQKCNVALSYFENFDSKPFIEYLNKYKEKLN